MGTPIELIVGLGNPGPRYAPTRHNAGAWFVDAVARRYGAALRPAPRFFGAVAEARIGDRVVRLLEPSTYMNESGRSVAALARFYKIPPGALLIAHDEIDLPPGVVRLKRGGGDGGHRGLRDVIPALGGAGFVRLRLGVGHPGHRDEVVDYVLRRPPAEEKRLIDEALDAALEQVEPIVRGDLDAAMNALHRKG